MAKIIGLIQVKGGAGRSTVATNLAGELARSHRVALVDCDMPQGTSASWAALRQESGKARSLTGDTAGSHQELITKLEALEKTHDYVVLDAPPRIAEITRTILVVSDLCLVPVGSSAAEVWATGDVMGLVNEAARVRKPDVRLVWTRFRAHTRLAQELSEQAEKALGIPALKAHLGFRVAYAEALGMGLTAAELADPNARVEVAGMVTEVKRLLR